MEGAAAVQVGGGGGGGGGHCTATQAGAETLQATQLRLFGQQEGRRATGAFHGRAAVAPGLRRRLDKGPVGCTQTCLCHQAPAISGRAADPWLMACG